MMVKKLSKKHKLAIGLANKGKIRSEQQKKQHSKRIKELWENGHYKNRNQLYRTKDWRKKVAKSLEKSWKNGMFTKERNLKISQTHQKNHKLRKRVTLICKICNKKFDVIQSYSRRKFCSKKCRKIQSDKNVKRFNYKVNKAYRELKEKSGCFICNYNNFGGSLDFHHVDIKSKKRRITRKHFFSHSKIMAKELQKCVLVCKNCHYELHNLIRYNKQKYDKIVKNIPKSKFKKLLLLRKEDLKCSENGDVL